MPSQEQKFYSALRDVFIGAKIEGKGGFVNLMNIKSGYYRKIKNLLEQDIEKALEAHPRFRDELFDKLYSFFHRYFTQNGSIYFNDTPFHNNIYEKVYTNEKDVMLFWKTQMLYYVKTDSILTSQEIEFDGLKFFFDASQLENKKANERKSILFNLKKVRNKVIIFDVAYSENGKRTDPDDTVKAIKKLDIRVTRDQLERAFGIFGRQSEVDFFINKNAKGFLQEQFKLWSYQYFWEGADEWSGDRVNQLQILKKVAFQMIDFISQFEDELVRIWNKPKFVKSSNYVITLDRLDKHLASKIKKHPGYKKQVPEWKELDIDESNPKAPIDTKYFKDLESDILAQFEHLDEALDGWLIKSENYQSLNTILPKFKGKVQTIYIDPPFNLDSGDRFLYRTNYKDSNWATLLENRLHLSKEWLNAKGSIFVRCDYNGNWIVRCLMDEILNYQNEIIVSKSAKLTEEINRYHSGHDSLLFYSKTNLFSFTTSTKKRDNQKWRGMHLPGVRWSPLPDEYVDLFSQDNLREKNGSMATRARIILGKELLPPDGRHWALSQHSIFELEKENKIRWSDSGVPQTEESENQKLTDNWTDFVGYSSTWGFTTENNEKIIERAITTSSLASGEMVCDFFLGSGTTTAVAHKLNRKWLGVEMGEHFYTVALPRMKKVLSYDNTGISEEVPEYKGGGFFKYYELEQYEEALAKCQYGDGDLLSVSDRSPYLEYVFMKDEKMLSSIEVDCKNNTVQVNLNAIYPNIDIAETLSNLTGKWIKAIKKEEVIFADDTKINTKDLDYKRIKPLIWWEAK